MKAVSIISLSFAILTLSCLKLDPPPQEERLPLFDWRIEQVVKVNGTSPGDSFIDVITYSSENFSYNREYVNYNFSFGDDMAYLTSVENSRPPYLLIESGSWTLENGILHLEDSVNNAFNEIIWLPTTVNDYEVVSYDGGLFVGGEFYHTILKKDVYFYTLWRAHEKGDWE